MFNIVCILFLIISNTAWASQHIQKVDVIAVEYPPFTTAENLNGGIAFNLLKNVISNNRIIWRPLFLPPKRAYKIMKSGHWCASFYPPTLKKTDDFKKYDLDEKTIKLGLIQLSKSSPFSWSSLDELKGKSVSMLRSDSDSAFVRQFQNAGLNVVFVETIKAAIKMVIFQRTDMAMVDNISFTHLDSNDKKKLQFSNKFLFETKISIYINNKCNLPELKILINNDIKPFVDE